MLNVQSIEANVELGDNEFADSYSLFAVSCLLFALNWLLHLRSLSGRTYDNFQS
jgi:hypothetical protein